MMPRIGTQCSNTNAPFNFPHHTGAPGSIARLRCCGLLQRPGGFVSWLLPASTNSIH